MKLVLKPALLTLALMLACAGSALAQRESKPLVKEKLFWLNVAASSADCIASRIVIDGRRVREGNPLIADRDGTVNWKRAIAVKVATVSLPAIVYKFNPRWGRWMMASSAAMNFGVVGYTVVIGFKYRF